MARVRAVYVAGVLALAGAAILIPAQAHEGHAKAVASTVDPNAPKKVSAATALAIGLKTTEVDFGQVEDVLRLTGVARPRPEQTRVISSPFAGITRSISVRLGDTVVPGMVLAEVESPELSKLAYELGRTGVEHEKLLAEVSGAQAEVASLEIEVRSLGEVAALTEAEVERLTEAGENVSANLRAQRRVEALRLSAQAKTREMALGQAKSQLASLQRQAQASELARAGLRGALSAQDPGQASEESLPATPGVLRFQSPIGGVVVQIGATVGGGVGAGEAILTIVNLDAAQVECEVPEGLLGQLESSSPLRVRVRPAAGSGALAEGLVRLVGPVIHPTRRTATLVADVPNPSGLFRDGQSVELWVVRRASESVVVVPASAVVKEGPLQYVFVKEGTGDKEMYLKRDIATGARDDRVVEVRLGLIPGDVVVSEGAFGLSQLRGFVPGNADASQRHDDADAHHGHSH